MPRLNLFVIPCSGAKLDHRAPVRQLYTGSMFRLALPVVEAEAELTATALGFDTKVLVLSAKHGLLDLDWEIWPYDMAMGDPEAISAERLARQLRGVIGGHDDVEISAFLPRAYLALLLVAVELLDIVVNVGDVYEGSRGCGDQRAVLVRLRDTQRGQVEPAAPAGAGETAIEGLDFYPPKPGEQYYA